MVRGVATLKSFEVEELVAEQGLGRHFASSFKSQFDIDWNDADQKRAVVAQLVGDARITLELAKTTLAAYARSAAPRSLMG